MFASTRLRRLGFFALALVATAVASAKASLEETRAKADKGEAAAQNDLGCIYETGDGVAVDFAEAAKWYRLAADQGHAMAQGNLGYLYLIGKGVPKDKAAAIQWWRKSAEGGCAGSMFNLALSYQNGEGVEKNPAEAAKWYRTASLAGEASAMANLGLMYEKGEGVEKDDVQAYAYYKVAAFEYRNTDAYKRGARLAEKLSVLERARGDVAVRALKAEIAAAKKAAK